MEIFVKFSPILEIISNTILQPTIGFFLKGTKLPNFEQITLKCRSILTKYKKFRTQSTTFTEDLEVFGQFEA